jgi:amino acid adenylation domain-containing protein
MSTPTIRLGAPPPGGASSTSAGLAASSRRKLLDERLRLATRRPDPVPAGIPPRATGASAPLSLAQRQLWYLNRLAPDATAYNECATLRKTGPIDLAALRAAFNEFVRRHEAWRTTFALVDAEPRQVVHEPTVHPLPLLDLSGLPLAAAERTASEVAAADTLRPYDLASGPLLRPRLVRLAPDNHRLYLGLHHIVFDGVSLYRVLLPEIIALYDAYSAGRPSPLAPPTAQYPDYAAWEIARSDGPDARRRIEYWRTHLADIPNPALPVEFPRPAVRRFVGGTIPLRVDAPTAELLRAAAQGTGATLFQLLTALYAWWLSRYSGDGEVVFATVADLRRRPELLGMVGYCLAPIVIRADLSQTPDLQHLIARVRAELLDGLDHAVPFQWLVQQLGGSRDPRRNPLFQATFELEPPQLRPDPSWSLHQMDVLASDAVGQSKFDLTIELDERPEGHIDGRLLYDADLFTAASADQMARHWSRLLESVATAPAGRTLAELDAVPTEVPPPEAETAADADVDLDARIQDLIHDQVERRRDAVAVVSTDRALTYAELETAAGVVAERLVAAGAGPGAVVALVLDRSVDLVVGLLGVLLSGAAYLPLDPRHPTSRLHFLVADAGATLLLTQKSFADALPALGVPVIVLDGPAETRSTGVIRPQSACATDLAYVLYTSGSTGQPKGVGVEHRSVTHLMRTLLQRVDLSAADVLVSVSSYTFDGSVGDIFCGLALGARIVLASAEQQADPRALADLLDESGATFLEATPTTWAGLVHVGWRARAVFTAASGGETLPPDLACELLERVTAVWNFFGPTEATVWATAGRVERGKPVTVGVPLPGTRVYVVDHEGRRTPAGVPGEIVIGGVQVARGYLNRAQETADRFGADPFAAGGRVYRTGDRGRLLATGEVHHLGRLDDQFKIRGFRIEPGEIESTMRQHPRISDAAIALGSASTGEPILVAYIVTTVDDDPARESDSDLRAWLRARLPDHLTPTVIVRVAALPRGGSGKLDRTALGAVELPKTASDRPAGPPARAKSFSGLPSPGSVAETIEEIWCELLAAEFVDRSTNFFDLGGHSLLAVTMLARVERELDARIGLSDFLSTGATVDALAELVDGTSEPAVRSNYSDPVFFLFPDAASYMAVRHFMKDLEPTTRVLGWPLRERKSDWTTADSVEDAATAARTAIQERQPEGPYRVAGYSLAGLVAYEVARQLLHAGSAVEWICLLDTPVPASYHTRAARLGRGWSRGLRSFLGRSAHLAVTRVTSAVGLSAHSGEGAPDDGMAGELASRFRVTPISAPLTVVASTQSVEVCRSPSLGWSSLHPERLTVIAVPGDHGTMFHLPGRLILLDGVVADLSGAAGAHG